MPFFEEEGGPIRTLEKPETVTQYNSIETNQKFISSIEGTVWEANIYRQILREDDEPRMLDTLLDPTVQQYQKINNYSLMLQSELSYSEEEGTTIITGEALLFPGTVVNRFDHFVADLSDNGSCIFVVTDTERLTYHSKSVYSITFELFAVSTTTLLNNLTIKTVQELYFNNSTNEVGDKPNTTVTGRQLDIGKLVAFYNDEFYDLETETILHPDSLGKVYDPFMAEFWGRIVPRPLRGQQPKPRIYKCNTGEYQAKNTSILDTLLSGVCYSKAGLVQKVSNRRAREFSNDSVLYSVGTSPIQWVVHPTNKPTLTSPAVEEGTGRYYILSEAFYTDDKDNYTELDKLVSDFLAGIRPQISELIPLINLLVEAEPEKRFLEIPIYLALLKLGV